MEKRKPHYDLSTVKSAIRLHGADSFYRNGIDRCPGNGTSNYSGDRSGLHHESSQFLQKHDDPCIEPNLAGCLPLRNACRNSLNQGYFAPKWGHRDPVQGEMK